MAVRRRWAAARRAANRSVWPVDKTSGATPPNWPGWPNGKQFALVLTHDVEGLKGFQRIEPLMALERQLGFRSSFNLVPGEEYEVSDHLIQTLGQSGFEVGVHGLEHDGKLYSSKAGFGLKAARINSYIKRWGAQGFRSPLMQHRLGWLHRLTAEYDASTFDTDPFEPEPDGVRTIFPFWVPGPEDTGFVELPYTLAQDFTLFVVLRENSINVWKNKLDWIAQRGGMAMLITHPDYMRFDGHKCERDEVPASFYEEFLTYVHEAYRDKFWAALPRDVNKYYRESVPSGDRNTRARICMVTNTDYAADNRVRRYAESLAARGDVVDVIVLQSSQTGPVHQLNGVNVYEIRHRLDNEIGRWQYIWQSARFLYASFVFICRRHHKIKYDLIHICSVPDFLVFTTLYPKCTGAKVILDIPEISTGNVKFRPGSGFAGLRRIVRRLCIAFSDYVILSDQLPPGQVARSTVSKECSVFENNRDPEACYSRSCPRDAATLGIWDSKRVEYRALVDSLCVEKFQFSDAPESDRNVSLEPRVSINPTAVGIIDENLSAGRDNDVH